MKLTYKKNLLFFGQPEIDPEYTISVFSLGQSWQQMSSNLIIKSWKSLWPSLFEPENTSGQELDEFNPEDDRLLNIFLNRDFSEKEINKFLSTDDNIVRNF